MVRNLLISSAGSKSNTAANDTIISIFTDNLANRLWDLMVAQHAKGQTCKFSKYNIGIKMLLPTTSNIPPSIVSEVYLIIAQNGVTATDSIGAALAEDPIALLNTSLDKNFEKKSLGFLKWKLDSTTIVSVDGDSTGWESHWSTNWRTVNLRKLFTRVLDKYNYAENAVLMPGIFLCVVNHFLAAGGIGTYNFTLMQNVDVEYLEIPLKASVL